MDAAQLYPEVEYVNQYVKAPNGDIYACKYSYNTWEAQCGPLHYSEITQSNLDNDNFNWEDPDGEVLSDEPGNPCVGLVAPYDGDIT